MEVNGSCNIEIISIHSDHLTSLLFITSCFQIPTSDVDLSVLASSPLLKTPDKTGAELEETKLALKELQRHFETFKAERAQTEE